MSIRVDARPNEPFAAGTEAAPSITFASDTDTGIFDNDANNLRFTAGGDTKLVLDGSSGNRIVFTSATANPLYWFNRSPKIRMNKTTAAAVAPGANEGEFRWEAGTNAGTLKLVGYAGTGTTGVTIIDNVGTGS